MFQSRSSLVVGVILIAFFTPGEIGRVFAADTIQVRVSPNFVILNVSIPLVVRITDSSGIRVAGATIRLTNAVVDSEVRGTGITNAAGTAIIAPVRAETSDVDTGIRLTVTSPDGSTNDMIIPVRTAAASFAVLEIRLIQPEEGTRPTIPDGSILKMGAVLRGIGTGWVSGWWLINGTPAAPFTAALAGGAPAELIAPESLLRKCRIGPNVITIRTTFPNRLESKPITLDVTRTPPATDKAPFTTTDEFSLPGFHAASLSDALTSRLDTPGYGPFKLSIEGSINTSMRASSTDEPERYLTAIGGLDVDTDFSTTTTLRLGGEVGPQMTLNGRTNAVISRGASDLGDYQLTLEHEKNRFLVGDDSVEFSPLTIHGLTSREVIHLQTGDELKGFDTFFLRSDSGNSGGLGASGRFDRSTFGALYAITVNDTKVKLIAAIVADSHTPLKSAGGYAAPQASKVIGLHAECAVPALQQSGHIATELAWTDYDADIDTLGKRRQALAYSLQIMGGAPTASYGVTLFNTPADYVTLGNPTLRSGARGWDASFSTQVSDHLNLALLHSRRSERFLLGGVAEIGFMPATAVHDWTSTLSWDAGENGPTLSLCGIWGSRKNDAVGENRIDQREQSYAATLTKQWGAANVSLSFVHNQLTDKTSTLAATKSRQLEIGLEHQLTPAIHFGVTWCRPTSICTGSITTQSHLLNCSTNVSLFHDRLSVDVNYRRSHEFDAIGQNDTTDDDYEMCLQYQPPSNRSLLDRLLANMSLQWRLLCESDPLVTSGTVHHQEIWLVNSIPL